MGVRFPDSSAGRRHFAITAATRLPSRLVQVTRRDRIIDVATFDGPDSRASAELRDRKGRMLDVTPARRLLDAIIERWNPHQIWLFGSRARGTETSDSDWDLLVVVPDDTPASVLTTETAWKLRVDGGVAADIVPCSLSDFREYRDVVNTLSYEAAHNGVLVHGR